MVTAARATSSAPTRCRYGPTDHTYYTQVNMTRTIEQILGLPPMNQFDLVASPMTPDFTNTPNFAPWNHVANQVPLNQGVSQSSAQTKAMPTGLAQAWERKKAEMFAGKTNKPDSVDADTLSHYDWYAATHYSRPFPGETKVRPPSDFPDAAAPGADRD